MLRRIRLWGRALARHSDVEREMQEEMQLHLERAAERLMARGLSRDEARAAARREFGNVGVIQEHARDARGVRWIEELARDTGYAARGLRRTPGFAIAVVLTLALGIGANTAMFGIVDRLLLRPPAYLRDPERVHRIYQSGTYNGITEIQNATRFPRYLDFRRFTHSFESIMAFATMDVAIGDGENARERPVTAASGSYFSLFDARPVLGRFFSAEDDQAPQGAPVVVLGYAYWQSAFGGRADALASKIGVGRTMCTIIGVPPPGFVGVADQGVPAMYVPITTYAWDRRGKDIRPTFDYTTNYGWFWLELVARRKPDVTIEAADADLTRALQLSWRAEDHGDAKSDAQFRAARAHADLGPIQLQRGPEAGPEAKVVLWVFGVALVVLLIACANVANLLLARAVARRREIALRLALGVSRSRLARQLLTESFILAILGGVAGLAVAHWGGAVIRTLFLPPEFATSVFTDGRTIAVTLVATITVALLTGVAPLSQALRYRLAQSLNAGGRDAGGRSSTLRTPLLIVQVMFSVVLLVGAGVFVRSLYNVRTVRLGFDVDPLVMVDQNLRGGKFTDGERTALERRLLDEVRAMPGVVSATRSPSVPYWGFEGRGLFVPGVDSVMTLGSFFMQAGDIDFFRTYGARILRGRGFDASDIGTSTPVMVVSEGMADALWPGHDPIGKCVRINQATAPCTIVVGVAEEMRIHSFNGISSRGGQREYTYEVPMSQYGAPAGTLIVRVVGDAADYAELIRRRLQPLMPGAAYITAAPLRSVVDPKMQSWRLGATMFAMFAALAIALAGIGLYSVMAYGVAQRRQEIGVRIALGASRSRVVRMIVRGGMRVVGIGIAFGAAGALAAAPWVTPLLFQESATDPLVFGIVAAILVCVGLAATAMPAIAASGVDPNVTLRAD